ncbi:MAG: efflux RND transporter periplasmic adaptor subunit [Litorimonas sp.]
MKNSLYISTAFGLILFLSGCGAPDMTRSETAAGSQGQESQTTSEHDDHDEDGSESEIIILDQQSLDAAGIEISTAASAALAQVVTLPAEIRFDADRVANVSPRVSGIISRLYVGEGDSVDRGDRLALIQSRELASLKARWQMETTRENLAAKSLAREEALFADKITSEADLQRARADLEAAKAASAAAENELHAAGVSHAALQSIGQAADGDNANAYLTTPISGRVVRRSVSLGETVSAGDASASPLFTIVDESVVWADIAVFKDDLGRVHVDAPVKLRDNAGHLLAESTIDFVLPVIDETSRTATARIVIDNMAGLLRPGQFITADISTGSSIPIVRILGTAVQTIEGKPSVFIPDEGGFRPVPIETGERADGYIEIRSGLQAGDRYVSDGSFTLKAQLEKDAFGGDDDH